MAHEIQENDGMALAGKGAWHGKGKVLPGQFTVEEGLKAAGLDWGPILAPLYRFPYTGEFEDEYGANLSVPAQAVVSTDEDRTLSIVSKSYGLFDNRSILNLSVQASGQAGAVLETAGSLKGRSIVFATASIGGYNVKGPLGLDEVKAYAMVSGSHNGTEPVIVLDTDIRVVCANTYSAALGRGVVKNRLRHSINIEQRANELAKAMIAYRGMTKEKREIAQALADKPMRTQELTASFFRAYRAVVPDLPNSEGDCKTQSEFTKFQKAKFVVASWLANMDDERQSEAGLQGTAWAAFNSVTQWANYESPVHSEKKYSASEQRIHNVTLGNAASTPGKLVHAVEKELVGAL